jgi:DUF1680 family protein
MTLNPVSPLSFPLLLRIPVWAGGATIQINGRSERPAEPNTFARVQRTWNAGDVVEIKFPLEPRASRWFNNSVTVERGPLVFSHAIGECKTASICVRRRSMVRSVRLSWGTIKSSAPACSQRST